MTTNEILQAYTDEISVDPGGYLAVHAAHHQTGGQLCRLEVRRFNETQVRLSVSQIAVQPAFLVPNASSEGFFWPVVHMLQIPDDWEAAVYELILTVEAANDRAVVRFVVRPNQPGTARILMHIASHTEQAYNNAGGKSLYGFNSTDKIPVPKVSYRRPGKVVSRFEERFIPWLETNNYAVEYITSVDLHRRPWMLDRRYYDLFLSVGHDEYWSAEMRDAVEAFTRSGGNCAFFSGNNCWFQVRTYEDKLICYKNFSNDPEVDPKLKTINWHVSPGPDRPANSMQGVGFQHGGYKGPDPAASSFQCKQPDHWVFEGTQLTADQIFLQDRLVYETDAAEFTGTPPRPTGNDGSPYNFEILAIADCTHWTAVDENGKTVGKPGWATMGLFRNQGYVFTAATTDWARTLEDNAQQDPIAVRITQNVLNRLSQPPPEPRTAPVYGYHAVNQVDSGWRFWYTLSAHLHNGWTYDGPVFYAYPEYVPGTVPVYRYHATNLDGWRAQLARYSGLTNGWKNDGIEFYAYAEAGPGRVPIYGYHAVNESQGWRYLYSQSNQVGNGWQLDGVVFYALTSEPE